MIRITIQKYHLKNKPQSRQAALISLLQPVTEDNFTLLQERLAGLLAKHYDCYILGAVEGSALSALGLKLFLLFRNTATAPTGLLLNEALQPLAACARLERFFVLADEMGAVIAKIEAKQRSGPG